MVKWMLRPLISALFPCALAVPVARVEDGSAAWLRYPKVEDAATLAAYRAEVTGIVVKGDSPTLASAREELRRGLSGLLGESVPTAVRVTRDGAVLVEVAGDAGIEPEGFRIAPHTVSGCRVTRITGGSDAGAPYGAFALGI
jgi:alpha-glucuronidase